MALDSVCIPLITATPFIVFCHAAFKYTVFACSVIRFLWL